MDDLRERFSEADGMRGRDHWRDIAARAARDEVPPQFLEWPPAPRRRAVAAVVAFAVFVAASVFAWEAFHPDGSRPRPDPSLDPFDLSVYPEGWTRLPDPPEVRSTASTAWTGSELLIWGGYEYTGNSDESVLDTGLRFDPETGEWDELPAAPLEARDLSASAWTGQEFLIWGGRRDPAFSNEDAYVDDGAAYDPVARTWRTLPGAPIEARAPFSVWTREELIVWGNRTRDLRYVDGAAYNPSTNTWRTIADAPIELTDATAVWTGEVMIVFGAALHGGNVPESETAIGAAYDPETDTWERIADSDLSPQASTAAWDGRHLIAWDYQNHTASYDWTTDTWRRLPNVDIWTGECSPGSVPVGRFVFGDYCGIQVLFYEGGGGWYDVSRRPQPGDVVVPIAAGPAAFVLEHDRESAERRMFVYVPPEPGPNIVDAPTTPFVPETTTEGDLTRMPFVWPDGSSATLVYPTELGLTQPGVQPNVSYALRAYVPPRYPILFLHGAPGVEDPYLIGDEPLTVLTSADGGHVELWSAVNGPWFRDRDVAHQWLVFRTESWSVLVSVARPVQSPAEIAAALSVDELEGYPVVSAIDPLMLSNESGEGEGSVLNIEDPTRPNLRIDFWLEECSGTPTQWDDDGEPGEETGSACLAGGRVTTTVYGTPEFVRTFVHGVRIENFRPA